ncbi:hypothetical protein PIB30_039623, partial [Stylosanthes scabra]|nr:hypothetical protein [Stylosanthes scabra]
IPLSTSSSSPTPTPPIVPKISIPLYHSQMLKPQMGAMVDTYPIDDSYALFLWIGTPVQIVFVQVDIGSPITWTQCDPCSNCYPMQRSPFNTKESSTLRELGCYSETCLDPRMKELLGNCTSWTCRYNVNYGKESSSFGTMVIDTLNFEHSNSEVKEFIMGCGDSYDGPYRAQFSGVLGLGRGPLSLQSQLNAKAFSFCLVSFGSQKASTLEFYDRVPQIDKHDLANNSIIMVPLKENSGYPNYYFLQFVGISINGFMLGMKSSVWGYGLNYDGGVILDIGSTPTYLPREAYNVFKLEIHKVDHNLTRKPAHEDLEFCYKDEPSNVYPSIALHFENGNVAGENFVSFNINNNQMLFRVDEGTVCLSFVEGKYSNLTVIGSNQLQGTQLMIDLTKEILVLTQNKC